VPRLATNGPGGSYQSETTWNGGSVSAGAGGGGKSVIWPIPSYQSGVVSVASQGSTTMRNVPDVALDADPNTGYAIYFNGGWYIFRVDSKRAERQVPYKEVRDKLMASLSSRRLGERRAELLERLRSAASIEYVTAAEPTGGSADVPAE